MMYNMLFYLKYSWSNQTKTKTAPDDCCLSLNLTDPFSRLSEKKTGDIV